MTLNQIEKNINKLLNNLNQEQFIFDFLLAYGEPKVTIARLKKSELNQLEKKAELLHRKKLFFKVPTNNLHLLIDNIKAETTTSKQNPRFILLTDYKTLLAYDTKRSDPNKMSKALNEVHHQLDLAVEQCYRSKLFTSDEEMVGKVYLFRYLLVEVNEEII